MFCCNGVKTGVLFPGLDTESSPETAALENSKFEPIYFGLEKSICLFGETCTTLGICNV